MVHDPRDPSWSKEETDYLLGLCEQFDLRFPVIHDRYSFPKGPLRSIEDLKASGRISDDIYGIIWVLSRMWEGKERERLVVYPV